jgi:hypothetical protein
MVVFTMTALLAKDAEQPAQRCDLDYWAQSTLSTCFNYGNLACERQQRQSLARRLPSALQA